MDNPIDGTDGKLGHGFTSTDELEEVDIGSGDRPRPTYVSAKLDPKYKRELVDLLKEFKDCLYSGSNLALTYVGLGLSLESISTSNSSTDMKPCPSLPSVPSIGLSIKTNFQSRLLGLAVDFHY